MAFTKPPATITYIANNLEEVRFDYQVTIDKFSSRENVDEAIELIQLTLPGRADGPVFQLIIIPCTEEDDLTIRLRLDNPKKQLNVHYQISLLKRRGQKYDITTDEQCFTEDDDNFKLCDCSRIDILEPKNELLTDDKLTIYCEFCCQLEYITEKTVEQVQADRLVALGVAEIIQDYARLWSNKKFSDLSFICAQGKELRAHKVVLAARSAVFSAMFEHDTKEAQEGKIELSDTPVDVCAEFLAYLYTGKVEQMEQFASELLIMADKYQVDSLKDICEEFICSKLTPDSVHSLLVLGDLHRAPKLKAKALDYFRKNTQETIDALFDTNNADVLLDAFRDLAQKTRPNNSSGAEQANKNVLKRKN